MTKVYDFRAFCKGELVRVDTNRIQALAYANIGGAIAGLVPKAQVAEASMDSAFPVTASPVSIDHAFDPVIAMLQQIAFPVASIVLAWACLQAMVGKPAAAVDRAKWAILGYLAMRYAPEILRHV